MKTKFSLRRSAIILMVILIIIAILNVIISWRVTNTLMGYAQQVAVLDKVEALANDVILSTAQVQQFITDVAATGNPEAYAEADESLKKAQKDLDELIVIMPTSKNILEDIRNKLLVLNDTGHTMADLYMAKGQVAGNKIMKLPINGFDARATELMASINNFIVPLTNKDSALKIEWEAQRSQLRTILLAQNSFSVLAFILTLLYLGRKLFKYLGAEPVIMLGVASKITHGNLSETIAIKDGDKTSLLASMHKMQSNLRYLISQIQVSAESINNGAQEISAGNTNLSQRTEEQASSLEQTASSMEQMASTVKQNAENAKQANIMANEASAIALKGGQVVDQVVRTMADINSSSKKIVDINVCHSTYYLIHHLTAF